MTAARKLLAGAALLAWLAGGCRDKDKAQPVPVAAPVTAPAPDLLAEPAGRPRYVFINETDDHSHDLALKMSLKAAEGRAGIENALILLKELPAGATIELHAVDLFRKWDVGRTRGGKGILYLYSQRENLFKIEVSRHLEGVFPDGLCGSFERAARTYMLSEIPQDFLSELLITMNLHARDQSAAIELDNAPGPWLSDAFLSGGGGVTARGYRRTAEDIMAVIRTLPTEALAAFSAAPTAEGTLERYLESLAQGLGDPQLPLLTEGSRIFRATVPRSPAQQYRVARDYRRALPHRMLVKGNLALAVFKAGVSNLPIVLRQGADRLWYVDEPKSWTYFHRFEDGVDFWTKYASVPFTADLRKLGHPTADKTVYGGYVSVPPPVPDVANALQRIEQQLAAGPSKDAALYARLGELYLFEMNWISRALDAFEKASALQPQNPEYHWRRYDLYMNNSEMEKALAELQKLAELLPKDKLVAQWLSGYTKAYAFEPGDF